VCVTHARIYTYIYIYIFFKLMYFSISSLKLAATRVQCLITSSSIQRYSRYSFVNRILRIVEIAQLEPKCDFSQKRQSVTNKSIDSTTIKRVIGRQVGDAIVEKELAN